jgi:hypothetical protein
LCRRITIIIKVKTHVSLTPYSKKISHQRYEPNFILFYFKILKIN